MSSVLLLYWGLFWFCEWLLLLLRLLNDVGVGVDFGCLNFVFYSMRLEVSKGDVELML